MKLKMCRSSAKDFLGGGEVVGDQPVSPSAQFFNSSVLCISILAVFDTEIPFDDSTALSTLENLFLPINPRFSSIMVKDERGNSKWKRVEVKLQDHLKVPVFPAGHEFYDDHMQEYLSKIAIDLLPQDRPLWDVHIIKYPTKNAAGTVVFKLHHSLGDGFSLMSALFSCLKRADNPSLPLTFPSKEKSQVKKKKALRIVCDAFSMIMNTARDSGWSLFINSILKDGVSPVRSGEFCSECRPINLSTVMFSLNEIKQIKSKLRATVNDVITGVIFYGIQLYLQAASRGSKATKVTSLVLLNTRAIRTYQSLKDMMKPDSKAPWGNSIAFLHVSVPKCSDPEKANPLDCIHQVKRVIKAKRNSLGVYLTAGLLDLIRKARGSEAASRYIHKTLVNTSMSVSNLIGPMEQVQLAGHPCKSFYFMVARAPQSLTITVVSYMGTVKVAFGTEKDYINSELLVSCMEKSFERAFEAAVGKRSYNNGAT